jgi:hypothetical protein
VPKRTKRLARCPIFIRRVMLIFCPRGWRMTAQVSDPWRKRGIIMKKAKKIVAYTMCWLLILFMAAPPWVFAQDQAAAQKFTQAELDQMLAPIALYPDSLLSQLLIASTYPLEVVMADRWVKENKGLQGDQLNAELDKQDWDPSVKALVPFPQVLAMMSERLEWTEKLGDAFLDQQDAVMDTIQQLREKAQETGNLKSGKEQKVVTEGNTIVIEPVNPEVIYVPIYDPFLVYGPWWYPDYPPFWYYPPGYRVAGIVFYFPFFCAVGPFWWFGWGHWDWYHHRVFVNVDRHVNINRRDFNDTRIRTETWHHDVGHRRGVLYGHEATRERFGQTSRGSVDNRRVFRGFSTQSSTSSQFHNGSQTVPQTRGPSTAKVPQGTPQVVPHNRGPSTSRVPQGTSQTVPQTRGPSTAKVPQGTPQVVPHNRGPSTSRVPQGTSQTVPQSKGPGGFGQSQPTGSTTRTIFGGMDRGSDVRRQSERGFQSRGSMSSGGGAGVGPRGGGSAGGGRGGSGQGGGGGHGGSGRR